jgi:large subunit ribosomal protein L24
MTKKPSSKSPRKQRRLLRNSPIHSKKRRLRCRLDDFLREEYGLSRIVPKRGDLARIMRGEYRDTEGKVIRVDYSKMRIYLDSASTTKADGKETQVPIHPSYLLLVKLELDDDRKRLLEEKAVKFVESE